MYATAGIDDEREKFICPSRFFSHYSFVIVQTILISKMRSYLQQLDRFIFFSSERERVKEKNEKRKGICMCAFL
jgi:hypothetical protein